MPLDNYGVLVGQLVRFGREDPDHFGSWYHGKLYVQAPAGVYECAVDVSSPSGVPVEHREVPDLDESLFAGLAALPPGWHPLARNPSSGALDFLRAPVLRGPGCDWVASTADEALDLLEARLAGHPRVFVFGAPYRTGLGVHDVHYNQGDPPGQFQRLDGIWQDGATVIESPTGAFGAVLTKFETQSLRTDDSGLPL
jgi:hypothetical protein